MLKLVWFILDLMLILIILTRTSSNSGLASFASKTDILGSPVPQKSFK